MPSPTISDLFLAAIATPDLPELGPDRREHALSTQNLETVLNRFFEENSIAKSQQDFLQAAALLWHDHLDESHSISQSINDTDGSFLHGIMHRREPDYSNAKYWFRRVGKHPSFVVLRQRVKAMANEWDDTPVLENLHDTVEWDPYAFVDACETKADAGRHDPSKQFLKEIQQAEFECLLGTYLEVR